MKEKLVLFLDNTLVYIFYAVIICLPLSIAYVGILTIIALVFFLTQKILSRDFTQFKLNKIYFILFLVFFGFMALSLFNSGHHLMPKSLKALFLKWGRFFFVIWMLLEVFQDNKRVLIAARLFVFITLIVALSALSQKFLGIEFLRHKPLSGGFPTGPFRNQNGLAAYLVAVIPIALSLVFLPRKNIFVTGVLFICYLVLTFCIILTYCRGSWVGSLTAIVVFTILVNSRFLLKKYFWPIFISLLGSVASLAVLGAFFFQHRGDSDRFIIYKGAFKMIEEHPFLGKGIGTFTDYSVTYSSNHWTGYAHNCYLQIWAESGIFSMLAFLVFNAFILYQSIEIVLKTPQNLNRYLLIGLIAGYSGFLVHSCFDTQLYSFQLSFLFWIVMGLIIALSSNLRQTIKISETFKS